MAEFSFPTDPNEICQCLYSTESYFSRCVGYCDFHKAYITARQLKTKNCLGKQCNALIKQTNNSYWTERSIQKLDRKIRKQEENAAINSYIHKAVESTVETKRQKRYICLDLFTNDLTSREKKKAWGMEGEVIQIGAVMMDENFRYISSFSTLVKPVYGQAIAGLNNEAGITQEMVSKADTFAAAFYKLRIWAGDDDMTTFVWGEKAYRQLWDEIYVKCRKNEEYFTFLDTFIDIKKAISERVKASGDITMEDIMRLCHLGAKVKEPGSQHSACNLARIINKLFRTMDSFDGYPHLSSYVETGIAQRFELGKKGSRYTTSIASFIDPALLEKFGYSENKKDETESLPKRLPGNQNSHSKHGIALDVWMRLSFRMLFRKDMRITIEA